MIKPPHINEELMDGAEELAEMSDKEIVALTLGAKNQNAIANYQMAMALKLRGSLNLLNENIQKMIKSNNFYSRVMIVLTIIIAILTLIIIFR